MKRIILIFALLIGITSSVSAKDTYAHDASALPKAAQMMLAKNLKSKVSLVKIEKNFGRISEYEVIMDDGSELTFDSKGNWENIEVNINKSVPSGLVPKAISDYVKKNQSGVRIIGIEKERNGYEVELSNGVEMTFDKDGKFLRFEK